MTQPQINDVNIPYPSASNAPEFKEGYRGSGSQMADGSVVFDWVTSARKRVWTLRWNNISSTDMEILRTAYNTVAGASASGIKWEPVEGGTFYVTLDPGSTTFDAQLVKAANQTIKYNVTLVLREV